MITVSRRSLSVLIVKSLEIECFSVLGVNVYWIQSIRRRAAAKTGRPMIG